jgi:D-alanyl-D-alanine carboxypeptidase
VDYLPLESTFLEGQSVDTVIFEPASAFIKAARDAGFSCFFSVAYRNTDYISGVYRRALANCDNDPVRASSVALASGLSDHQTGLAVDFTDSLEYSCCYTEFWDDYMRDTELYQWLVEHCADYGFILRYPEGKEEFYGLACQHPAHFRYVGTEAAHFIMDNGLCLEEFLMLYEGNDVYLPEAGQGLRIDERG